jgi:hypothetical protein
MEMFCCGDILLQKMLCYRDVMLRRRYVTDTFFMETFCQGDVLCRDILYVRLECHRPDRQFIIELWQSGGKEV